MSEATLLNYGPFRKAVPPRSYGDADAGATGDVFAGVDVGGYGDADVVTEGEVEGLGDTDGGGVDVYVDDGAGVLAAEDPPPYGDLVAAEDTAQEAGGDAPPEAVCPPCVGAVCDEISAVGWDGIGMGGCPVNEVSANAAAPDAARSAPRIHASTSDCHGRRRGRVVLPGGS